MRRRVLSIAVVAGVIAIVALRACTTTDQGEDAAPRPDPTATVSETGPGPASERHGVPLGWSHDEAGARAAAVSAIALTGDIARAGFITRDDMIRTMASRRFGPALARDSAAQLKDLVGDVAAAGVTPTAVLFHELPLTVQVVRVDDQTARVEVWAVLVVGLPDHGAPRQLWRTVTVDLVWETGDWRVDGWTARSGPTPALATNAPIATVAELAEVTAWPTAGGG